MSTSSDAIPASVEVRFRIEPSEPPLAYPVLTAGRTVTDLDVEVVGPGVLATITLPLGQARVWAGELFSAVSVACREATGDSHALTDAELGELGELDDPDAYDPGPGMLVVAAGGQPGRVRFHLVVDIQGDCLSSPDLRAGLVDQLAGRFNTTRIAVSDGQILAGLRSQPPEAP
jgi:hypothetical protein